MIVILCLILSPRLAAAAQGMGPLACGDIVDPAAEEMGQRELEKERARKEAYMYGIPLQKGEEGAAPGWHGVAVETCACAQPSLALPAPCPVVVP